MPPLDLSLILFVLLASFVFLFRNFSRKESSRKLKNLPPGPRGMPILGHLLMLGKLPHQTLARFAKTYGPIVSIKLGSIQTVVVSSPRAAELFLKTHDNVFASRPRNQAGEMLTYGNKAMGLQPLGPYWRNVRKLCIIHLLSMSRIEQFKPMKIEQVGLMVNHLKKKAEKNEAVNISKMLSKLFENIIYKMFLGSGEGDHNDEDEGSILRGIVDQFSHLAGSFNISDYFPLLAPFDLQGLVPKMKEAQKSMDELLEKIIDDHERLDKERNQKGAKPKDFLGVLLALLGQPMNPQDENSEIINKTHIKSMLLDMTTASLETSTTALEWTFSEMMKNYRVMRKLQDELKAIVGLNRMVEVSDLPKLTYLDMVIKEGFRLHPVLPFLIPRESIEDVVVDGFFIPKKSRIIVNAWAMGRDPAVWGYNAQVFYPERFENNDIDILGHDFRLIPFGAGRRICPGMQTGLLNVRLVLAQLVHCFDWEMPIGMAHEELDMEEKFGLSVVRVNHVFARPTYRLNC